jgi:hypothetical protein
LAINQIMLKFSVNSRVAASAPPHANDSYCRVAASAPPHANDSYCRVAASAPRSGANNVASGKAGRAAATRGVRIPPPHRAPRSGAYKNRAMRA